MADFGYDVTDYCDVDPLFGDLADFDRLLADCHDRGIRLLVDLVPNHTSDQHPWFRAARSSRDDPKRDWYVWRDGSPDTPPNNWIAAFSRVPAWTWDEATGQWYLHLFLPEQPDLNWANPEVVEAMHDVMRFWLDRGVDGFRIDVVHGIGKDPGLPDDPPEVAGVPHCALNDTRQTHELLRGIRRLLDAYPGDRLILGEVYLLSTGAGRPLLRRRRRAAPGVQLPAAVRPVEGRRWRAQIADTDRLIDPRGGWPTWVLSNHDNPAPPHPLRQRGPGPGRAVPAAGAAGHPRPLRRRGARPRGRRRPAGPGGRPRRSRRLPGPDPVDRRPRPRLGRTDPWLPWPPGAGTRNVEALLADATSIPHLYRRLLAARKASPALQLGDFAAIEAARRRRLAAIWSGRTGDDRVVAVNMGDEPAPSTWPVRSWCRATAPAKARPSPARSAPTGPCSSSPRAELLVLDGHSGGGAIAHAAADARPGRIARVVYVDSWPLGTEASATTSCRR